MVEILFVDDEEPILKSLKRTFRNYKDWNCHFANSPLEALKILATHSITVLVSDHRMPQMEGAEFLARVKEKRPNTVRIMLTGQANLEAVQQAVNSGEIYRFMLKPWDDDDLKQVIESAIVFHDTTLENKNSSLEAKRHNDELRETNEELEKRVNERTRQVTDALYTAKAANTQLKHILHESTKALAALVRMARPDIGAHSKRVSEHSRAIAERLNLSKDFINKLEIAALLHDTGKLSLPAFLIEKNVVEYSDQEMEIYRSHSASGARNLENIPGYDDICAFIKYHHERYNGQGFPEGLRGESIPTGAYVIGIADRIDHLLSITNARPAFVNKHAFQVIADNADVEFPERLTQAALDYIESLEGIESNENSMEIGLSDVAVNMTLARDIYSMSGSLLIAAGSSLTPHNIKLIRSIARVDPIAGKIYVVRRDKAAVS